MVNWKKKRIVTASLLAWLAVPMLVWAQHYPAGSEGITAATLPPPGVYFEDQNTFYYSDKTPGFYRQLEANPWQSGFYLYTYTQAPKLTLVTHWKFLGADYGVAAMVPFEYLKHREPQPAVLETEAGIPVGPTINSVNKFGLSDIEIEPLILAWHLKQFDIVTGYAFWAPTGEYDHHELYLLNLGYGCWSHMFTLGATWHPDTDRKWAVSLLNHYEINMAQYSDLYSTSTPPYYASRSTTPGETYTLEWAISRTLFDYLDAGLTGYYQQQVTATEGPTWWGPTFMMERSHVAGIGPEISATCPEWGLTGSLRYAYEFSAMDHPQGQAIHLTVTKTF